MFFPIFSLPWFEKTFSALITFLEKDIKLMAVGVMTSPRSKAATASEKGRQCYRDLVVYKEKGGKGGSKGGINNCDSCVDVTSRTITGRFQHRNAEQISQTAACTKVQHGRQSQGTTHNSCLIPNFCLDTLNLVQKHNLD